MSVQMVRSYGEREVDPSVQTALAGLAEEAKAAEEEFRMSMMDGGKAGAGTETPLSAVEQELASAVAVVGEYVSGEHGNRKVEFGDVFERVRAAELSDKQRMVFFAALLMKDPSSFAREYARLPNKERYGDAMADLNVYEELMKKDPLLVLDIPDKLSPPVEVDRSERFRIFDAAAAATPKKLFERYAGGFGDDLLAGVVDVLAEHLVLSDPDYACYSGLGDTAVRRELLQPRNRQVLLEKADPTSLLRRSQLLQITQNEQVALVDTLLREGRASDVLDLQRSGAIVLREPPLSAAKSIELSQAPSRLLSKENARLSFTAEERKEAMRRVLAQERRVRKNEANENEALGRFRRSVRDFLTKYPDDFQEMARATEDQAAREVLVTELCDRFATPFDTGAEEAIAVQKTHRALAMELFRTMSAEAKQRVLPSLIEHALDADFGDAGTATALASELADPRQKKRWSERGEKAETTQKRQQQFQRELAEQSRKNKGIFLEDMKRQFGEETVRARLKTLEGNMFVTINVPASQVFPILESGRLKSVWEQRHRGDADLAGADVYSTLGRVTPGEADEFYLLRRHAVERQLGIRSKGTENDPHPVYGALAAENGKDEKRGAAPDYGSFFFRLKPKVQETRTAMLAGDSFHTAMSAPSRLFHSSDAAVAKAKVDLEQETTGDPRWSYVDVPILGGVKIEDIESLNIPADRADQPGYPELIRRVQEEYPNIPLHIIAV